MKTPLFPDKTLEQLETEYVLVSEALYLAAAANVCHTQVPTDQAILDETRRFLDWAADGRAQARMSLIRSLSRPLVHIVLAVVGCFVFTCTATAQAKSPNAPSWTKTELALDAADLTIRTLDLTSTHTLLMSPCKCWREADFLAPKGEALAPLVAFQYGLSAAVITGSHELRRHHHPRLALALTLADLASESWAVQHNLRQHDGTPVAHTGLVRLP